MCYVWYVFSCVTMLAAPSGGRYGGGTPVHLFAASFQQRSGRFGAVRPSHSMWAARSLSDVLVPVVLSSLSHAAVCKCAPPSRPLSVGNRLRRFFLPDIFFYSHTVVQRAYAVFFSNLTAFVRLHFVCASFPRKSVIFVRTREVVSFSDGSIVFEPKNRVKNRECVCVFMSVRPSDVRRICVVQFVSHRSADPRSR